MRSPLLEDPPWWRGSCQGATCSSNNDIVITMGCIEERLKQGSAGRLLVFKHQFYPIFIPWHRRRFLWLPPSCSLPQGAELQGLAMSCTNVLSALALPALANREPQKGAKNRRDMKVKLFIPRLPSAGCHGNKASVGQVDLSTRLGVGGLGWVMVPHCFSLWGLHYPLRVSLHPSHRLLNNPFINSTELP